MMNELPAAIVSASAQGARAARGTAACRSPESAA